MLVAFQDPLLDTADPPFMHLFQITERLGMLATGMPGDRSSLRADSASPNLMCNNALHAI